MINLKKESNKVIIAFTTALSANIRRRARSHRLQG
jgi:hypothetical protein